ncbi:MAG: hypothetical protein WCT12_01260 [Verrucomicrobiota bacterium]
MIFSIPSSATIRLSSSIIHRRPATGSISRWPAAQYAVSDFGLPGVNYASGSDLMNQGLRLSTATQPGAVVKVYQKHQPLPRPASVFWSNSSAFPEGHP